jgi:hypothetical protein
MAMFQEKKLFMTQEFKIDGQSEIKEPIGCMVEDRV